MGIEIIQLNVGNANLLQNLDEEIFDEKIDFERLAVYLKELNHIMIVAVSENVVVGQVLGVIHRHPDKPTELYIDDLAVSEKLRRKGIATQMLEKVISIGTKQGCEEIWVATEPDNEPAIEFYKSLNLAKRTVVVFEGLLSSEA